MAEIAKPESDNNAKQQFINTCRYSIGNGVLLNLKQPRHTFHACRLNILLDLSNNCSFSHSYPPRYTGIKRLLMDATYSKIIHKNLNWTGTLTVAVNFIKLKGYNPSAMTIYCPLLVFAVGTSLCFLGVIYCQTYIFMSRGQH